MTEQLLALPRFKLSRKPTFNQPSLCAHNWVWSTAGGGDEFEPRVGPLAVVERNVVLVADGLTHSRKSNEPCWIRTSDPLLKSSTQLKPEKGFSELHLAESRKVTQEIPTSAPWAHLFTPGQSRQARSNVHKPQFW